MLPEADRQAVRDIFSTLRRYAALGNSEGLCQTLWANPEHLRAYLHSFILEGSGPEFTATYVNDALARFFRTLCMVPLPPGERVLEIGGNPYLFHLLFRNVFPDSRVSCTNFFDRDIFAPGSGVLTQRMESAEFGENYEIQSHLLNVEVATDYPFPENEFDLIFFCETLEHLVVQPFAAFDRLRTILQPGGYLVVTLPNAVRLTNLALMLSGRNFFDVFSTNGVNGRHNREYTLAELVTLLRDHGFEIVRAETHDRFDYDIIGIWSADYAGPSVRLDWNRTRLMTILQEAGGTLENRGDNLYVLARKPA